MDILNPQEPQEQNPASPLKIPYQDYLMKVVKWMTTNEGLTRAEARHWMNRIWDPPLPDGARTGREELSMLYEEGLPPEMAAQVLMA